MLEITRLEKQLGELRRGLEKILAMKPDLEKIILLEKEMADFKKSAVESRNSSDCESEAVTRKIS